MPFAVCNDCEQYLRRSGARGSRLTDYCCPACGGKLRNARTRWDLLKSGEVGNAIRREEYALHQDNQDYLDARAGELIWQPEGELS